MIAMNTTVILFACVAVSFAAITLYAIYREARKILSENPISYWEKSGRTPQMWGKSGTKIGSLTERLIKYPYQAYTTAFDIEISSGQLADEVFKDKDDWRKLQSKFVELTKQQGTDASNQAWRTPKNPPLVTLLVDHSGSMRGDVLEKLVVGIDCVSRHLKNANIPFEILGFTTTSWRGGSSRIQWLNGDNFPNPGRLCDLMYITYKSYNEEYEAISENLALMLVDNIRRENLDGEAILWANERFKKSRYRHWLCVVVCDGAPVDDSTLTANNEAFLVDHLREVVSAFANKSNTEIFGFGIGCEIDNYYPKSAHTKNLDSVAQSLALQVQTLLEKA